ncbi:MAG: threonine synthase [Bacteroidota bacterium]
MHYYSTNHKSGKVTFSQALIRGQAPDKGLYLPETVPLLPMETILGFTGKSYEEIAFEVAHPFLAGEIDDSVLRRIVGEAYNYEVPLEHVAGRKYVMRLDRGPTASFKDFAARMMGRLMQHYLSIENKKLLILTATSGDTGSAVASAFYGLENIELVVLFPQSEVTGRQRKQMTTLGKNVRVLALDAKFDDCQALVKQAFADHALDHLGLSSANSINIGRLVPQIVYYFYAFAKLRLENQPEKVIFSVPSGNFGDMMGGILAMKMGLPVRRLIIATNENDEFPAFLSSGKYRKIEPSRNCISSAMNVGHPSNLARVIDLYGGNMDESGIIHQAADMELLRKELYAISISDTLTRETICQAYRDDHLLLEPHGAVGWAGLAAFLREFPAFDHENQLCVSLETAHPAKFPEEIHRLLGIVPHIPPSLEGLDDKPENFSVLPNQYRDFREYLLKIQGS